MDGRLIDFEYECKTVRDDLAINHEPISSRINIANVSGKNILIGRVMNWRWLLNFTPREMLQVML